MRKLQLGAFFLGCIVFSGMACANVTDQKVRGWIAAALEGKTATNDAAALSQLQKPRSPQASLTAWKLLKECRDAGKSLDLDLASAEHYLFIRAFAAEKGERDVEALPGLYGALKKGLGPVAQLLRTSNQPVSPPDAGVLRWGNVGAADGLSDYTANTSRAPKEKTGKYEQYKLALEGYYINYTQSTPIPSCRVKPK